MKETSTETLTTRLTPQDKRRFVKKASRYGTSSEVMRELIVGFAEDRVTIEAPSNHKGKDSLYVTGK